MKTKKGYIAPNEFSIKIKEFNKTNVYLSVFYSLIDHFAIIFLGLLGYITYTHINIYVAIFINIVILVLITRFMRSFECLVHETSHYNFTRNKRTNDFLANILVAYPVLSTVKDYRLSHDKHHNNYRTDLDPDKIRYDLLGLDELDRTKPISFIVSIISKLNKYVPSWWKAIGVNKFTVLKFIIWHSMYIFFIFLVSGSFTLSIVLWSFYWFFPFFFLLPVNRFIGESAEHKYNGGDSVFDNTYNNIGFIHHLIFHPHNDGYHVLHHLYAYIPHYKLRKVHNFLGSLDSKFFSAKTRYKIFEEPS